MFRHVEGEEKEEVGKRMSFFCDYETTRVKLKDRFGSTGVCIWHIILSSFLLFLLCFARFLSYLC